MAASRRRESPLPLAQAFVVCREIVEDCRTHEFVLIKPLSSYVATALPQSVCLSIYAHLTCGHGDYRVSLQLHNTEDLMLWEWECPQVIRLSSPLEYHRFALHDALLEFPELGRHDLLLLTNGKEVARHAIHVLGV